MTAEQKKCIKNIERKFIKNKQYEKMLKSVLTREKQMEKTWSGNWMTT